MITGLPKELTLSNGESYPIRWDFRAALDLMEAINDPDVTDRERGLYLLTILYEDYKAIPEDLWDDAAQKGLWFLRGGEDSGQELPGPKLMDWVQDYPIIVPAVNRVAGCEVRELPALHWWTFLGYYQEIGGDCTFAQVVGIRSKLAKGKKLDKSDQEYYNKNRRLVDLKVKHTTEEDEFLTSLVKKKR